MPKIKTGWEALSELQKIYIRETMDYIDYNTEELEMDLYKIEMLLADEEPFDIQCIFSDQRELERYRIYDPEKLYCCGNYDPAKELKSGNTYGFKIMRSSIFVNQDGFTDWIIVNH